MVKLLVGSCADNLRKLRKPTKRGAKFLFILLAFCTGALVYILRTGDLVTLPQEPTIVRRARSQPVRSHSRAQNPSGPQFPDEYHSKGVLSLPYGDIVEPFEVWYSGSHGMSRIDYYGGMDRTYQRSDLGEHGFACKIVPEFSEKTQSTFKGCLHRKGSKLFSIKPQSIIPSFEFFKVYEKIPTVIGGPLFHSLFWEWLKTVKFDGHVKFKGKPCTRWKHSFKIYNKVNTYTFYTSRSRPYRPIRYEMMGYDTLLSSYYDHYILEYHTFDKWKYDYSIFKIPTNVNCFDFTNKNLVGAVGEINPMSEFMPHSGHSSKLQPSNLPATPTPPTTVGSSLDESEDSLEFLLEQLKKMPYSKGTHTPTKPTTHAHTTTPKPTKKLDNPDDYQATLQHYEDILNELFSMFKIDFKKKYDSHHEHERRKDIYRHNMRFIKSRNRQHLTYKLKPNHMADMTAKEIEQRKGLLHEEHTLNEETTFMLTEDRKTLKLPAHVDWRKAGAVGHVKSQGICGSCYAFAVAGALEGAYFIKTGSRLNLSEQQIVDCTWGFGNRGCKGGYPYRAMQWILKHGGLATEESYGRYLAQEGYCHFKNTTVGAKMESYMNIKKGNTTQLKMAVAFYGPVTILINTQPKSFKFYGSGVYYDEQCTHALDHAALAVGYGVEKGVPYWLVKNSWSEVWGDKGYIKIAMKNDNCGVAQKAVVISAKQ